MNGYGSGANPRRAINASSGAGGSEITPSRRDQYHQQGLKMVEDVFDPINIRSNGNILDYRTDIKEGGLTTLDGGEIIMSAETQLIPISYKQVDRMSLDKFAMLNPSEMNELVKKEARQDRITAQISYQSPEERLDDLKRRNLDFDTLMAEMSKECRHIYEDEIGIRPVKRGQGVETLDQIIDNLYNDDFKVKNLPPKSKSTNTEAQKSSAEVFANQEKHVDSPSFFNPDNADSGIQTEKFNMKVKESPEHLFDSFEGSKLDKMPESKEPNIFSIEDVESPRAQNSNKNLPIGSLSSVASKENNSKKSEQGKEGIKVSSPIDNNKKTDEHKKSPVPQIVINPPKNVEKTGASLQPEVSFGESSNPKSKVTPLKIDSQKDKPEETKKIKIVLDKDIKNKEPDSESDAGDRESDDDGQKDSDADDGDEEVEEGGDEGTEEDEELGSEKDGSETPASKRDHSESGNSTPAQGAKKGLLKKGTLGDEQLNKSESKKKVTFSEP